MRKILFRLLLFAPILVKSQWINLVPNYSFEHVYEGYPSNPHASNSNNNSNTYGDCLNLSSWQLCYDNQLKYWQQIADWRCPERDGLIGQNGTGCNGTADVEYNNPNWPRTGEKYLHTTNGEYVTNTLLNSGLKQGKTYYIEIFSDTQDKTFYLASQRMLQHGTDWNQNMDLHVGDGGYESHFTVNGPVPPEFIEPNPNQFVHYSRTKKYFTATKDYPYIAFGSGGQFDDVRIYEVPANGCVDNWYFDNTEFNYPMEVYKATNNIYIGKGVDPENEPGLIGKHIPGDVYIHSNSSVIFQAGSQVILTSGFSANPGPGQYVKFENTPCTGNSSGCPNELNFSNKVFCNNTPQTIGDPNISSWGTTVTWAPATYLSDPHSSNPTFTPPSGTGAITYTVTVNYECDSEFGPHTSTSTVVVSYGLTSGSSPWVAKLSGTHNSQAWHATLNLNEGVTRIVVTTPGYYEPQGAFSPPTYVPFSQTLYLSDFTNGQCSYFLPDAWRWPSCIDQPITFTAYNDCTGESYVLELIWPKSQYNGAMLNSHPYSFTPNGDGITDDFCLNSTQAIDTYELSVATSNTSPPFFTSGGSITTSTFPDGSQCLWSPSPEYYLNSYFYCVLVLRNNCGQTITESFSLDNSLVGRMANPNNNQHNGSVSELKDDQLEPLDIDKGGLEIMPNPAQDNFNIVGQVNRITRVEVTTLMGVKLFDKYNTYTNIDIGELSAGTYIVRIYIGNKVITKKLIKM